jgi:hypothetical protein
MKKHKQFNLVAASLLAVALVTPLAGTTGEIATTDQPEGPFYRPFTLGLEAGTTGFGGSASWRFADHFGFRAGGDYFSLSDTGYEIKGIHYNAKLRLLSEPLTLDIYPWINNSFHISAGIMFNQNRLTGTADQVGTIVIGGQPFPAVEVGRLNMKIEQQLVNPYLSIGGNFFYFDRAHRWAMGGELGVAYTGDPDVSLTRSGPPGALLDEAVSRAKHQLNDYADKFRFWPIAKLAVTYSF